MMLIQRRTPLCVHATLLMLVLANPVRAAEIVVFGDSWGVPAAPALQTVLTNHGHSETVAGAAAGGETASNLSSATGLLHITNSLVANPDVELVHLSIGGNDFLGTWNSTFTPAQEAALFQAITDDVETIVDHILTTAPGVLIFWSSYDYPRPLALGTPTQVNAASANFQTYAQALDTAKGSVLTAIDFSGLMQVSYGFDGVQHTVYDPPFVIPPGDPSLPDPTLPSPNAAHTDSIHLTGAGYLIFAEEQYLQFYSLYFGSTPVPTIAPFGQAVWVLALAVSGAAASARRGRVAARRRSR